MPLKDAHVLSQVIQDFGREVTVLHYSRLLIAVLALAAVSFGQAAAQPTNPELILATTTSTQDSGLLDVLVPMFEQQTQFRVKTISVGTGQAMALGVGVRLTCFWCTRRSRRSNGWQTVTGLIASS